MGLSNLANKNTEHLVKFKFQIDNKGFSINMPIQYLVAASTKKSSSVDLTFKLTGCLVFYLATLFMGKVENIHPYLQNDFTDTKGSSDQILS